MKIKSERDKRTYLIIALCAILVVMGVGYAAFSSLLTINGTANISNSWCVGFDNTKTSTMEVTKGVSTGTQPTGSMTYSGTACGSTLQPNSSLNAHFYQPGDEIEYTLTITNKSTVTAAIKSILVDNESVTSNTTKKKGNITYVVEMPVKTTLAVNESTTMKVIAKFQNETDVTGNVNGETQSIEVKINAEQDDGNGGFTPESVIPASNKVYAINTNSIYKGTSTLTDIGTTYESCAETGKNVCLRYTIENNTVTDIEGCFVIDQREYCLLLGDSEEIFNTNVETLQTAYSNNGSCKLVLQGHYSCGGGSVASYVQGYGYIINPPGYIHLGSFDFTCVASSETNSAGCADENE